MLTCKWCTLAAVPRGTPQLLQGLGGNDSKNIVTEFEVTRAWWIIHLKLPVSLLPSSSRHVKLAQLPSETGIAPLSKTNKLACNFSRQQSMMDHTLARELVVMECKARQLDTISKWFWNLTCQKKWIKEIWGRPVARILHLPWSLLRMRSSSLSLIHFPSDSGIWPVKKEI